MEGYYTLEVAGVTRQLPIMQVSDTLCIERLVEKAGGEIVAKAAILAEGDAARREDIIFLEELPLFPVEA